MKNPGQGFQAVFGILEMLLISALFVKVILYRTVKRLKEKKALEIKATFWFYISFILSQLIYSLFSVNSTWLTNYGFSEVTISYIKSIFFTGSFTYALIYLYKITTDRMAKDIYKKGFIKDQKKRDLCTKSIYCHCILLTLMQALMVGLTPYVLIVSSFRVEIFTSILAIIALSGTIFIAATTTGSKSILHSWIGYFIFTNLVIPLSFIISTLEMFIPFYEHSELYGILLRAPFIVFRFLQLAFLAKIVCTGKDLKEII